MIQSDFVCTIDRDRCSDDFENARMVKRIPDAVLEQSTRERNSGDGRDGATLEQAFARQVVGRAVAGRLGSIGNIGLEAMAAGGYAKSPTGRGKRCDGTRRFCASFGKSPRKPG